MGLKRQPAPPATYSGEPLDRHEPGQARWVPVSDVVRLAGAGELLGAGTLVGLLQYVAERTGFPN